MPTIKRKINLIAILLPFLSGCTFFRENPEDLKKIEGSVETQIDVGLKATAPDTEEKE